MKKIISILLVLLIAVSVTACSSKNDKNPETLPLDVEQLKENWQIGELVFANEKSVELPCTVTEMVNASELGIYNEKNIKVLTLKSGESKTIYLTNDSTRLEITCKNKGKEDVNIMDSTVIGYNLTNVSSGNRKIKFAGTLTPGVTRADVEKALELPENAKNTDTLYYYNGKNEKNKNVELIVSFNSDNIVNSVSFSVK